MHNHQARLGLGTVQFGLPYGVVNQLGQVSLTEVRDILAAANNFGMTTLDTASAYGQSEEVLGQCGELLQQFSIVTKLPPGTRTAQAAMQGIERSLSRLRLTRVDALLMHAFEDYHCCPEIVDALRQIKSQGLCQKIGFSLYYPKDLQELLDGNIDFDMVQLPYSIIDRRFEPYFKELSDRAVDIHVRSVFLQGAVFMLPEFLPEYLKSAKYQWQKLHSLALTQQLEISSICLNFVLSHPNVHKVIIGVDSLEHLKKNVGDLADYARIEALRSALQEVAVNNDNIVLPFLWKK